MEQLILLNVDQQLKNSPVVKNIEWVDLRHVTDLLKLDTPAHEYRIYKTGGTHFWGKIDPVLFGGNDWPFVQNMKNGAIVNIAVYGLYPMLPYIKKKDGQNALGIFSRIIAMAFVEKIEGKDFVDHINHNTFDFRSNNLRWLSRSENNIGAKRERTRSVEEKYWDYIDRIKRKMGIENEIQS